MSQNPDHRHQAAIDWIVRTNDPDFEAWDAFTLWLEADPSNADAYHRLAGTEIELRPLVAAVTGEGASAAVPRPHPRARWAIAASVAVVVAVTTMLVTPRLMPIGHSTAPGELKTVSLGGSDQLVLNGDTEVTLSGFDRRHVRLDHGQIFLRLNDAERDQVNVVSGDLRLVDIGTKFEVSRDSRSTRVLVSEGVVVANPGGAELRLTVGQRLETRDGATKLQAVVAAPYSAGSFERGQLLYLDEPIERVVIDLRRSTGIDFSMSKPISGQRFSGTLSVAEVKREPRSLGPLLGVSVRQSPRGWTLGALE